MSDVAGTAGSHRLLALDGGGMRGAFTLGVLGVMEDQLRDLTGGGDDFVLADYFDFIGGTSTGAIIATGLALGWTVDTIKDKYRTLGKEVFKKRFLPLRAWSKYRGDRLREQLRAQFGELKLNDPGLRTRLLIVLHNRTTDSPWPLTNEPTALYNVGPQPTRRNSERPLWELLSASTAAPSYFPPVHVDFGDGTDPRTVVECVDGGVTAHNNPSLQLLLSATLPEYRVNFPTGPDRLLLVSVGTGTAPRVLGNLNKLRRHIVYVASSTPSGLMFAAANHNDVVCRALGVTRFGPWLDSELKDMMGGGLQAKLFTYARYNVDLSPKGLATYDVGDTSPAELTRLDAVEHVETLIRLGREYALAHLDRTHFDGFTTVRRSAGT